MSHLPLLEVTQDVVSFSPAVVSHLVQEDDNQVNLVGKVAKSGNIAAIAKGANLDIINLSSNERLAAWSFCSSTQEPETEITCLVPFSSDPASKSTSHVLVGLDTGLHGLLAVFDITESRVVRAVALPQRVGSVALISACGGPATPPYFHPALLYFHGIVAVGMMEGRTLLLDLNMDESVESSDSNPAGVFFIGSQSRDVARLRRKAIDEGTHMGLEVAIHTQGETFTWDKVTFPSDCVQVTCLHFCPQLASLAVGYNCGVWLLLPLTPPLVHTYTSPYTPGLTPVVGLAWQEPLDDPRHYTYYWVIRGMGENIAMASLYSLTFRNRQCDLGEGPCYENLESVTLRFEHELGGDPVHGGAEVSRVISVDALELALGTGGSQDRSGGSDIEQVKDMGLVVMVWECDKAVTYMGVFDINRWYEAHMPGDASNAGGLCSYLSICEVGGGGVVDLSIDVDSIAKFGPTSLVEQHFYPSSLKFNLTIVSREGLTMATHLGLQRKVLAELSRPSSLVQPSELYQFCLLSGLATGPQLEPSLLTQRKVLLTVALEQSMVGVVVAAVRDWADGRYSKAGCSLKFLLDWAWDRVVAIKEMIDSQTVPLFDHSLSEVDEGARGVLVSLSGQLAQLVTVLSSLSSMSGVITLVGQDQLECRLNVTGLILLYTQAISWFVNVGLLPEQVEGPGNPYPVTLLEKQYRDKRTRLGGLQGHYGRPGLMVDILCEDIGDDLICNFQKAGGTGAYPPPSLHSLITTFLSESPAPAKLRLVQYFFLDLAHLLPPDQFPDLVDNLIKFPSAFSLPPSVIKLTQAFWLLDHEDWEEAVSMMLDPLLQEDDLTPVHHRAILVSLLAQSQPTLALKYTRIRRPPCMLPQDVSLHTSVLLANGAIQEAFTFQRSRRGTASSSNILAQFYRKAEELGKLDAVLQLSLTSNEEKEFVSFLQASKRVDSQEVLLMYYLQRSRFTEAMQLNHGLKTMGKGGSSAREAIMDRYNHILPSLANTLGTRRVNLTSAHGMCSRPVPLSVTLQDRNIRLSSHATAIEARLSTPVSSRAHQQATPFRTRGKRGEREGIVRPTDVTHSYKRKADEEHTICYPNETFQDTSLLSSTKLHGTNLVSPPRKRTRLSDVSTLNMSVKSMRRMSRYMNAEAITILSTPTITKVRKAAPSIRNDSSLAPSSILKVKQLIKDTAPAVEGEKILDVSLSLEKTPVMGSKSRDITPTKSLRFKEPNKLPSDLAKKPVPDTVTKEALPSPDDSELSNDTNDSFHSFNNSGHMDVDSPLRHAVDSCGSGRPPVSIVDSPLASKSFGGRASIGTLARERADFPVPKESEEVITTSSSMHSVSVSINEDGGTVREESSRSESGITITSVSESTRIKLEEVLKKAEDKLREREPQFDINVKTIEGSGWKSSEKLNAADHVLKIDEVDDSQDSDIFMHGKSWERNINSEVRSKAHDENVEECDDKNDDDDYESEDDKYYDNKTFEKKVCNIVLEESEDSRDTGEDASDESKDRDTQAISGSGEHKPQEVAVLSDDRQDCEVIIDTSEDENDKKVNTEVEELEDTDDSESEEVKGFNYSWADQGTCDKYERQIQIADEIKKLVTEEEETTIKVSAEVVQEESVIIDDEGVDEGSNEAHGKPEGFGSIIVENSQLSTIDLDESAEEKVVPSLSFSTDNDDSMEVDDEVIEIDSDEDQDVNYEELEARGPQKLGFSTILSQSSQESEEELDVSNKDEDISQAVSDNTKDDELVIVEDSSNSSEFQNKAQVPAAVAEAGSVLFSTFGNKDDETVSEKLSDSEDVCGNEEIKAQIEVESEVFKDEVNVESKDTHELVAQDSVESEPEEDPVFFEEEEPFDLEADFFSPGAKMRNMPSMKPGATSYSYDVTTSEVDKDRKPSKREESSTASIHTENKSPMDLVQQIIAEANKEKQDAVVEEVKATSDDFEKHLAKNLSVPDTDTETEKALLDSEPEKYDKLELRNRTVTETLSLVSDFGQNNSPPETEAEKYDKIELRNRTVTETLSLVSDFGQDIIKDGVVEEDDMRELLDEVSTTATRASSIAGSIFGETRAGSASGSVFGDGSHGHGPTFSFSEPGLFDQSEFSQDKQESRLNFNFSMPLDSSIVEYDDSKEKINPSIDTSEGNAYGDEAAVGISKNEGVANENEQGVGNEKEEQGDSEEEEDNESDVDSESEDEQGGGLEFSWTKIPPQKPVNVSDLVNEEVKTSSNLFTENTSPKSPFLFGKAELGRGTAKLVFSEPLVESVNQDVDLNNSQFDFGEPLDESMNMEVEGDDKVDESKVAEVLATPSKIQMSSKTDTPLRRSTRKASRDDDALAKSETIPHQVTRTTRKTPAKNTPTRIPAKPLIENDSNVEVSASGRPKRGGTSSEPKLASITSPEILKPSSIASTEPLESDNEEKVAELVSEESAESSKKRGRPKKKVSTPTQEKTISAISEVSKMDTSSQKSDTSKASTVPMSIVSDLSSSTASINANRTAISSELKDLALTSTTPATPVRRSRRLSGVTPLKTPTFDRSRRASGTITAEIKPLALDVKYDKLELRSRTVTESLSLVSDFGQGSNEEVVEKGTEKFDTLELRNRSVTETLSLKENFGKKSDYTKPVTPTDASSSIGLRKTRRRSTNLTPEGSPVSSSAPKASPKVSNSSPLAASSMSISPKESPKRSTRSKTKSLVSPEAPATPTRASAIPKHLTPLKKVLTPKEESQLTPTRRSRRVSSGDIGSGEPLTPTRRSRRLSGATNENLNSAPDGGLISGGTPRKTPSTPRSRRHTSVRPEDVESALAIAGGTPLPTLVEEEEREESINKEDVIEESVPIKTRGRKAKPSTPSLNVISEEDGAQEDKVRGLPDVPSNESELTHSFPLRTKSKRKDTDQLTPEAPPKRRSRRVTITTLGTDVDLFTPGGVEEVGSTRRESTGGKRMSLRKYVPVKKKTSVRIK